MKKLLGLISVSLWAGALLFAPAPADAWYGKYVGTSANYFACSQYSTMTQTTCTMWEGEDFYAYTFHGMMLNTIPISYCAGACNGTENLMVYYNPGNGRKYTPGWYGQCGNGYIYDFSECNTCS